MKKCPQCGREYDLSMSFCLDDGAELLYGPAKSEPPASAGGQFGDEPQTAILHSTAAPGEAPTRAHISTTDQTAIVPTGTGDLGTSKSFDKRLLLAPLALAIIVLGGFFGYRYFDTSGAKQINSIAVLPFENRSGSGDTEYLSDGLADSLIYRLSQLPNLKVSPTSSVMRYKGTASDTAKVANELGVDAVMTGRLSQIGDSLNISVQLVDVKAGKVLWAEQYDRKLSDLLATQREIATAITSKLQLKLVGDEGKGATKKYTDSNEAYQAYLKGRYFWNRRTAENIKKAIEQFKEATDKDPSFALAYAGLADCYLLLPEYAGTPINEAMPQAKAYADRAISIDENLAEGHASLGGVNLKSWKWAEAEREFKRAIELNPNYATAYHWYCVLLRSLGRFDDGTQKIEKAQELDPLSSVIGNNVAQTYMIRKDFAKMNESALKLIELYPTYNFGYQLLGESYLKLGRETEALANLQKSVEMSNKATSNLSGLGYGYAVTGKRSEADAIIKELEDRYAKNESSGRQLAAIYAGLGEKDKAFEWLEKDFQSRSGELAFIRWYMQFESLRDDPRFKNLLKRMGLPE